MSYHGTLNRLTDDVQAKVLSAYAAWEADRLTRDQFVQLTAAHVAQGNTRAVALADLALATALSVELGTPQPTVGVSAPTDGDRLRRATRTLADLAVTADISARLARFATAEPTAAAANAWSDGIRQSDLVEGWSRRLDADPCELCQSWAAGDHVFPKTVGMLHHPGCQCTPKPVITNERKS